MEFSSKSAMEVQYKYTSFLGSGSQLIYVYFQLWTSANPRYIVWILQFAIGKLPLSNNMRLTQRHWSNLSYHGEHFTNDVIF